MNHHPAEFWIKFLLSRREHTYDEVAGMCEAIDLGGLTTNTSYLAVLDEALRRDMPTPFRGYDKQHNASMVFLRRQGIFDGWHKSRYMRAAMDLLGNSTPRALLETFILAPVKPDQAVRKIEAVTGIQVDIRTYDLFRHFFWNPTLLNAEEWGDFIAIRRASHKEWLRLAVTAQGPQGVQLILWKTGAGSARHIEASKMFGHLRNIAYLKALELEHEPAGKDNSIAFRNYVESATKANVEATASAGAMADILDSFKAFKMKTGGHAAQSMAQLTSGGETFSEAEDHEAAEDAIKMEDY